MGKSRLRGSSPVYLNPSPTELSPPPSIFEDWDQETAMDTSRPTSLAIPRTGSPFSNPPSLTDILSNSAPPPWTLSSFMAFLSQNHCLETLEFILDADRYREAYYQMIQRQTPNGPSQICSLWRKVIDAYIMPCSPREVNLPSHVRDYLLELPCYKASPPNPSELDEAVQIVRELINDSVLVPFLESVLPPVLETRMEEEVHDARQGRSRLRIPRDVSTSDEASTSPRASYLPMFIMGSRNSGAGNRSTATSMETVDVDMMTDDSSSPHSSSGTEPMTPPTTPPTSDFTYNTSPSTLQRAISGNSWKKMGAKSSSIPPKQEAAEIEYVSWDDPHPGERLQIPLGVPAGRHSYPQTISGDAKGGVAVKAGHAHEEGSFTTGRSDRGRRRNTKPKQLEIPAKVAEESEAKGFPFLSPPPCSFIAPISPLHLLPLPEPLTQYEPETDTETVVGTETGTLVSDGDRSTTTSRTCLSDFSNYLGICQGKEEEDSSVTLVDPESYMRTNSVNDAYGWEAELDRKMRCSVSSEAMCPYRCEYQRPDSGKRGLLQRVWSSGRRMNF
ncbi:uncharacterized protein F4807DRAFT_459361 [Annulohypoxylon truncatum]|uniref:uncharacterized protein n=1 Tax=Annulohypoxylon truncatum TaxID=327061 RepID=UPI0020085AE8|nr:uncharacterized protein F4807DRAFT_459361 [Annulohypoxylon truncatum]KAI1210520.1 hypothetical protein F4807DRAFT_459361 [Annulohypoxylon truncatum]